MNRYIPLTIRTAKALVTEMAVAWTESRTVSLAVHRAR